MLTFQQAFVQPAEVLGKAPPAVQGLSVSLGPSAPHDDHDDEEVSPGEPPRLGGSPGHYTNVLDQIWAEYERPEQRTAERLKVLFDQTVKEASRMHMATLDFFESVPFHKIGLDDRMRYQVEFARYLKRLNAYRVIFERLPPSSTDTDAIYIGLVKTRQGAGPVPDCIMHLYFREQIDVLAEHVEDMSEGFVARVLDALDDLAKMAREAAEAIERKADDAETALRRLKWIVGGTLAVVVTAAVGGLVVAFRRRRSDDEP
jgi:hypothetical protein